MPTRTLTICLTGLLGALLLLSACQSLGIYHTVRQGETLYAISRTYKVPVDKLAQVNFMRDPNVLIPGEKLFIPGASEEKDIDPRVIEEEKLNPHPPLAVKSRPHGKGGGSAARVSTKLSFIWPTDGILTSGFGSRWGRQHNGIDLSAPVGKPIFASADGKVAFAQQNQRGYGHIIILEHDEGFLSVYAHNSENLVNEGDAVKKGDLIGKVGQTGNSTGPHLHFEIRYHREAVDPLLYLP